MRLIQDIRIYQNYRDASSGLAEQYKVLLKDFNVVAGLFCEKLRELKFRTNSFQYFHILVDQSKSELESPQTFTAIIRKGVLEIVVGFPSLPRVEDVNAETIAFTRCIANALRSSLPSLGGNVAIIDKVETLLLTDGLDLELTIFEKRSKFLNIKVFAKCCRLPFDPIGESSIILHPRMDYIAAYAIHLTVRRSGESASRHRLLFEIPDHLLRTIFSKVKVRNDEIEFVPKDSFDATHALKEISYPKIVPLFD